MTIVTAETLTEIRDTMSANDQARALEPGCETWAITYGSGQRGQMTRWPNGRGAVCFGGLSLWGDWDGEVLRLDDGSRYDRNGNAATS